jgi:hypothetical protein
MKFVSDWEFEAPARDDERTLKVWPALRCPEAPWCGVARDWKSI